MQWAVGYWGHCRGYWLLVNVHIPCLQITLVVEIKEACGMTFFFPYLFIYLFFISWRLITLQYCSGFCHTLTWISHGVTCIPHPNPPSHLPLHPIPLGLPSAPGLSTCLMHPTCMAFIPNRGNRPIQTPWLEDIPCLRLIVIMRLKISGSERAW